MNTIEKVKKEYESYEEITPLDIAGFRLFLRHHIYDTDIHTLQNNLSTALSVQNSELYGNTICIYPDASKFVHIDETNTQIIDTIRYYISSVSDRILYYINYDSSLTKKQKNAYKKILLDIPVSRSNFAYLLNISYTKPIIAIML